MLFNSPGQQAEQHGNRYEHKYKQEILTTDEHVLEKQLRHHNSKDGLISDQSGHASSGELLVKVECAKIQVETPPQEQQHLENGSVKASPTNSSSQTQEVLQDSAVNFSDMLSFVTSSGEMVTSSPLSVHFSEPKHSASVQSVDCLPTFTSQRPPDLPSAVGEQTQVNSWNVSNIQPNTHRYDFDRVDHISDHVFHLMFFLILTLIKNLESHRFVVEIILIFFFLK